MPESFKDLYKLFDDSLTAVEKGIDEGLYKAGERVKSSAKAKLGRYQAASGPFPAWPALKPDTVRRKGRGRGEAPLVDTGRLRQAIKAEADEGDAGESVVYVGTSTGEGEYAAVHEFGSLSGSIPSRPYLRTAVYENREQICEDVSEAIMKGLRSFWK